MNTSDLDDVCGVIGYRATRVIVAWFSGHRLWVPTVATADHPLALLIGRSAFTALVREFAERHILVPGANEERRYSRDRQIAEWLAEGRMVSRIAADTGLSIRRVEQVRADLVRNGWLTYAQGFRPDVRYARGRRRLAGPKILTTGEVSAESPRG